MRAVVKVVASSIGYVLSMVMWVMEMQCQIVLVIVTSSQFISLTRLGDSTLPYSFLESQLTPRNVSSPIYIVSLQQPILMRLLEILAGSLGTLSDASPFSGRLFIRDASFN